MIKPNPWDTEPTQLDFECEGLPCAMRRGIGGHWCGYVAIPKSHPLYGCSYNDAINNPPAELVARPINIDKVGAINLFCAGRHKVPPEEKCDLVLLLDVHGGLTWGKDRLPDEKPDGHWWLGFDCAHAGDASPTRRFNDPNAVYRDADFVRSECESLAKQLASWPGVADVR